MSLFDKLPLDISEIIYKESLKDHFNSFSANFIDFHLKCAKKRLTYRFIKYRKFQRFADEMIRLLHLLSKEDPPFETWHEFQNKVFHIYVLCNLVDHNTKLITRVGNMSLINMAQLKMHELFHFIDLFVAHKTT